MFEFGLGSGNQAKQVDSLAIWSRKTFAVRPRHMYRAILPDSAAPIGHPSRWGPAVAPARHLPRSGTAETRAEKSAAAQRASLISQIPKENSERFLEML